jgi:exopolyphosphatase / guanosine-5'-triphosphate,3'-diphosphate pyrophosphatase
MGDQGPPSPGQDWATAAASPAFLRDSTEVAEATGQSRFPRSPTYAAIDLGTNNCRLLIARPSPDGFVIVDAFSRIVRLGEGLAASGRIADHAMNRAIDALSVCAEKLSRRRVNLSRAVATEACRAASNGGAFVEAVRSRTGIMLDIISARDEARLAMLGCHQLLEEGKGAGLIFDIGGGSTELVLIDDSHKEPAILDWESIPWGVVSLTEAVPHDSEDPDARAAAYVEMRRLVRTAFGDVRSRLHRAAVDNGMIADKEPLRLLGTSGTVTTLGSLHLGLPAYDRRQVDGMRVATADMLGLCTKLAGLSLSEREQLPCVGRERADLVVAGCAILEEICAIWPAPMLGVADRGIREGVLRLLMSGQHRAYGT